MHGLQQMSLFILFALFPTPQFLRLAETKHTTPKLGHRDLLKPAERYCPWAACLFVQYEKI